MSSDPAKWQYWSGHISGWQASGLTRRVYCAREGLSVWSFDYWRSRVVQPAEPALPAARQQSTIAAPSAAVDGKALTLVAVRVKERSVDGALLLRSPAGWNVTIPASVSAQWLADVLKQLP